MCGSGKEKEPTHITPTNKRENEVTSERLTFPFPYCSLPRLFHRNLLIGEKTWQGRERKGLVREANEEKRMKRGNGPSVNLLALSLPISFSPIHESMRVIKGENRDGDVRNEGREASREWREVTLGAGPPNRFSCPMTAYVRAKRRAGYSLVSVSF